MPAHFKPIAGYPSRTAAVLALQASGLSRGIIARELGLTSSAVGALIHSAERHRPAADPAAGQRQTTQTVEINYDVARHLRPFAARRGTTVRALAREIIEAALDRGLIDTLLDGRF